MTAKPELSFRQVWNMCVGFLGIQFAFALQNADVSRIFQTLGADLRWQNSQIFAGDQSNQEPPLPGFATLNLNAAQRLGPRLTLFGAIENLTDARYDTYGAFTGLDNLPPSLTLTNPRTVSPAEGRTFTLGLRVTLN